MRRKTTMPSIMDRLSVGTVVSTAEGRYVVTTVGLADGYVTVDIAGIDTATIGQHLIVAGWRVHPVPAPDAETLLRASAVLTRVKG